MQFWRVCSSSIANAATVSGQCVQLPHILYMLCNLFYPSIQQFWYRVQFALLENMLRLHCFDWFNRHMIAWGFKALERWWIHLSEFQWKGRELFGFLIRSIVEDEWKGILYHNENQMSPKIHKSFKGPFWGKKVVHSGRVDLVKLSN